VIERERALRPSLQVNKKQSKFDVKEPTNSTSPAASVN